MDQVEAAVQEHGTEQTLHAEACRNETEAEGAEPVTQRLGRHAPALGGGKLGVAFGVQLNQDSLQDQPDAETRAGNVFGSIQQAPVDAERKLRAAFFELALPFTKAIEAQVAVRTDRYSGAKGTVNGTQFEGEAASKTSPKFAIKYKVSPSLVLRASHARSFLAPSLKQLFGGVDELGEVVGAGAAGLNAKPVP